MYFYVYLYLSKADATNEKVNQEWTQDFSLKDLDISYPVNHLFDAGSVQSLAKNVPSKLLDCSFKYFLLHRDLVLKEMSSVMGLMAIKSQSFFWGCHPIL